MGLSAAPPLPPSAPLVRAQKPEVSWAGCRAHGTPLLLQSRRTRAFGALMPRILAGCIRQRTPRRPLPIRKYVETQNPEISCYSRPSTCGTRRHWRRATPQGPWRGPYRRNAPPTAQGSPLCLEETLLRKLRPDCLGSEIGFNSFPTSKIVNVRISTELESTVVF